MEEQLPLEYWATKSFELPILPQVAQKAFSTSATSAKLERMFSTKKRKIPCTDCWKLLPRNLETLLYLEVNSDLLWLSLPSVAPTNLCSSSAAEYEANTQAQVERSNTAHNNLCQAFAVLQAHLSGALSPPPLLSNVKKTSEEPSLDNSTVLLTVKRCYSVQLFVL